MNSIVWPCFSHAGLRRSRGRYDSRQYDSSSSSGPRPRQALGNAPRSGGDLLHAAVPCRRLRPSGPGQRSECPLHRGRRPQRLDRPAGRPPPVDHAQHGQAGTARRHLHARVLPSAFLQSFQDKPDDRPQALDLRRLQQRRCVAQGRAGRGYAAAALHAARLRGAWWRQDLPRSAERGRFVGSVLPVQGLPAPARQAGKRHSQDRPLRLERALGTSFRDRGHALGCMGGALPGRGAFAAVLSGSRLLPAAPALVRPS